MPEPIRPRQFKPSFRAEPRILLPQELKRKQFVMIESEH